MLFSRKKEFGGTYSYLIVGLGNPGPKYEMTRHNAGFLAVDLLALQEHVDIKKLKFHALVGDVRLGGERCLLMKPQTMMNLSGDAVAEAANFYKIPPERVLVLFDDISLDVGRTRVRRKGSAGGHNGIKSIIARLGSQDFPRVKIGVGQKPDQDGGGRQAPSPVRPGGLGAGPFSQRAGAGAEDGAGARHGGGAAAGGGQNG